MTHEQANRGKKVIMARRRLTEKEVRERVGAAFIAEYGENYPVERELDQCINSVHLCEVWTDSSIGFSVVYNAFTDLYIIISTGEHYDLIK